MSSESPVGVRRATPEDLVFIRSSWFHSAWKRFYMKRGVAFEFFRAGMNAVQDRLLKQSIAYVSYAREMPSEIIGYSVLEDTAVHYVYVKAAFRRQGVARALLGKHVTCYTHETSGAGKHLFEALHLNLNLKAGEPK